MKKIINSSKEHSGLVLAEVLIILGAVLVGEYSIRVIGISSFSLFIALPAILIGLIMRSYFTPTVKKNNEKIPHL